MKEIMDILGKGDGNCPKCGWAHGRGIPCSQWELEHPPEGFKQDPLQMNLKVLKRDICKVGYQCGKLIFY